MFNQNRDQLRQHYFDVWQKLNQNQPLTPLEEQIAQVIAEHPEYHAIVSKPDMREQDFPPELGQTNPFLHMGLHLAIREQVATNRPAGIQALYNALCKRIQDHLEVEHKMMDHLVEAIWQAQRVGQMPDEQTYLDNLRHL